MTLNNLLSTNIPVLKIYDRTGWTQYIDFIHVNELTANVMKGVDTMNRFFFVVMMLCDDIFYVQTFFQRYSDDDNFWMEACCNGGLSLIDTVGGMTKEQHYMISNIIQGNKIEITSEHRTEKELIGKIVQLHTLI